MKILHWINLMILYLFTVKIFGYEKTETIGAVILTISIIYGILAKHFKSREYLYGLLIGILFSDYYLFDTYWRVIVLAVETVLLGYYYSKSRLTYIKNWTIIYSGILITALTAESIKFSSEITNNIMPVLNIRTVEFIAVTASLYMIGKIIFGFDKQMYNLIRILYTTMMYFWATMEITLGINYINNFSNSISESNKIYTYIILGFIYSIQINHLANKNKVDYYQIISDTISIVSLISLYLYGTLIQIGCPVINIRSLTYISGIVTLVRFYKIKKHEFYLYSALITGIWIISLETIYLFTRLDMRDVILASLSIIWLIYAGIITLAGTFKNIKQMINTGIFIISLTILKILFLDLININPFVKIISFGVLGTVLLIISYFYNKIKNNK